MSRAPLTVVNAEITTAAVEVKTLTIRGKQVTLAVFRQIRHEPIFDDGLAYRGNPWGTVNYHGNHCLSGLHRHVVWQTGNELRQAEVSEARLVGAGPSPKTSATLAAGEWLAAYALIHGEIESEGIRSDREWFHWLWRGVDLSVRRDSIHGKWARIAIGERVDQWTLNGTPPATQADAQDEARLRATLDALCLDARADYDLRLRRWHEIESLPQLFIAV